MLIVATEHPLSRRAGTTAGNKARAGHAEDFHRRQLSRHVDRSVDATPAASRFATPSFKSQSTASSQVTPRANSRKIARVLLVRITRCGWFALSTGAHSTDIAHSRRSTSAAVHARRVGFVRGLNAIFGPMPAVAATWSQISSRYCSAVVLPTLTSWPRMLLMHASACSSLMPSEDAMALTKMPAARPSRSADGRRARLAWRCGPRRPLRSDAAI